MYEFNSTKFPNKKKRAFLFLGRCCAGLLNFYKSKIQDEIIRGKNKWKDQMSELG